MSRHVEHAIDVATATRLMSMGEHPRAQSQLDGAVALHNILERERVAYLADEVGLGKTYVALGTLALFRHFNPGFRALVIAPKANIQTKWKNDWMAFVRTNWHVADLRVRGAAGGPAREVVLPERLSDFAYESMIDDDRDFICRLPSFSFALFGTRDQIIANVRRALPWLRARDFPRDEKSNAMRDFVAQAYNAALPRFDLVIIDEAHNLGGGVSLKDGAIAPTSIRNAVLAQVLGNSEVTAIQGPFADTYGSIADRVLMLSATPIETSYKRLWNQLHLVDKASPTDRPPFEALKEADVKATTEAAARIMIRRINALSVNGMSLTKNLYRRTWYQGGVSQHDSPLPPGSARERLTVALVQKLVADEIGAKFNNQFQMGMLASFESFGHTALRKKESADATADGTTPDGNFDESDQADSAEERMGADTTVVNRLAQSHAKAFGCEMAHPKMDALVDELGHSWERGDKALVFVRRIASVKELKRKLDEKYDKWLFTRLERGLSPPVWSQVERLWELYQNERISRGREESDGHQGTEDDPGGADTFFSWFFRGKGPAVLKDDNTFTIESGASVAQAVQQASGSVSTFFAQHHVADLLDCAPDAAFGRLAIATSLDAEELAAALSERAAPYLPTSAGRRHRFDAVQLAALELLAAHDHLDAKRLLRAIGHQTEASPGRVRIEPRSELAVETFFTRLGQFPALAAALNLQTRGGAIPTITGRSFARHLLATAARRGHSLIDLYVAMMRAAGARPIPSDSPAVADKAMGFFLAILDEQRRSGDRSGAFWELSRLVEGSNLDLIRAKNLPEAQGDAFLLSDAPTLLGQRLGAQQPTVGMVRRVNTTAVQQFRMPGYPYVLICTDVLREGEDLHLFCDRVIHYGVAWTPSALEQRNGRVDRLYSLAERRFSQVDREQRDLEGHEQIQIQIPYVPDTVEVLQARRVIERMHRFTELMHHNVDPSDKRLDIGAEIVRAHWEPPQINVELTSAFEILPARDLTGLTRFPATPEGALEHWWQRLRAAAAHATAAHLFEEAEYDDDLHVVYSWRRLADSQTVPERVQPYTLKLASRGHLPLVQVMTPVGRVPGDRLDDLHRHTETVLSRITMTQDSADREYNVAIEGDVILGDPGADAARIGALIERVTRDADQVEHAVTGADLAMPDVRRTLKGDALHDI